MGQANITWVQGQQFIGTDSTNHSVVISSPQEGIGMKPSELLLVSLGSCTAYDVVNLLTKRREPFTGLQIQVTSESETEAPWRVTKIHLHYKVSGQGVDSAEVEKAIKLSKEKYCSVSQTLEPTVEITYAFEVTD